MKFSKGPWGIDKYGAIVGPDGNTINIRATVSIPMSMGPDDEAKANARLIAAAPDLYEALELMATYCNNLSDRVIAEEALTKARGES